MIASVKRLTSWLDSIITYLELDGKVYITPFLGRPMPITTLPEIEPVFPGNLLHLTPFWGTGRKAPPSQPLSRFLLPPPS